MRNLLSIIAALVLSGVAAYATASAIEREAQLARDVTPLLCYVMETPSGTYVTGSGDTAEAAMRNMRYPADADAWSSVALMPCDTL